jgi:hypothetical protein
MLSLFLSLKKCLFSFIEEVLLVFPFHIFFHYNGCKIRVQPIINVGGPPKSYDECESVVTFSYLRTLFGKPVLLV